MKILIGASSVKKLLSSSRPPFDWSMAFSGLSFDLRIRSNGDPSVASKISGW